MCDRILTWTDTDKYPGALKAKANIGDQLLPNQCALTEPGPRMINSTSSTYGSLWQNFLKPLSKYTKKLQDRVWCILWDHGLHKASNNSECSLANGLWDTQQRTHRSRAEDTQDQNSASRLKGSVGIYSQCAVLHLPPRGGRHRASHLITDRTQGEKKATGNNLP